MVNVVLMLCNAFHPVIPKYSAITMTQTAGKGQLSQKQPGSDLYTAPLPKCGKRRQVN